MTLNPEHRSYEELSGNFTWAVAEKELEYKNGDEINSGGTAVTEFA